MSSTKPGPREKAEAVEAVEAGEVVAASVGAEDAEEAVVAVAAEVAGIATAEIAAAVGTAAGSSHRTIKNRSKTGEHRDSPVFFWRPLPLP